MNWFAPIFLQKSMWFLSLFFDYNIFLTLFVLKIVFSKLVTIKIIANTKILIFYVKGIPHWTWLIS